MFELNFIGLFPIFFSIIYLLLILAFKFDKSKIFKESKEIVEYETRIEEEYDKKSYNGPNKKLLLITIAIFLFFISSALCYYGFENTILQFGRNLAMLSISSVVAVFIYVFGQTLVNKNNE